MIKKPITVAKGLLNNVLMLMILIVLNQCAPLTEPSTVGDGRSSQSYIGLDSVEAPKVTMGATQESTASPSVARRSRPGLGTGWGDEVNSKMSYAGFVRHSSKPAGLASIYYNDKEGIHAMTKGREWRDEKMKRVANNLVEWGVKGRFGYYPSVTANGKRFVVGSKGKQYSLVIKNICDSRLEMVLSVDGLDVIDGDPASLRKRGYIVDPGATLTVRGFRTSEEAVAAFKFSSVGASYTNMKHGSTRNVGVMGLAVYSEKGVDPWRWSRSELQARHNAQAFAEAPNVRGR